MRKFWILMACCLMLLTTAYAANAATDVQVNATVAADGSCQVGLSMSIRLDEPVSELVLPLGTDISSVRVNGSLPRLQHTDNVTEVKLGRLVDNVIGTVPIMVTYTVNSAVTTDEDGVQTLSVPLLYGFPFPVEKMGFSVTLPNSFDSVPTFLSGYHEQDIESQIQSTVSGATVTGSVKAPLKDHETLTMTLLPPEGMFPQAQAAGGSLKFDAVAMGVCGGLALLYWLICMACLPRFPMRRSTAPEGVTAGCLGSYMVHKGADLSLMVVTWAQLGYLIIHLDDNGRVILHKKMEMGNERSSFESRTFRNLFGKGMQVDATGYRFARLSERTAAASARLSWGYKKHSGNPKVLRILGCCIGMFAGIAIGDCLTSAPAWRIILMVLLGFFSGCGSWYIQEGMSGLHLRGWMDEVIAAFCAAALIAMGIFSQCLLYAIAAVASNLLIGVLAAYSGKRTENGQRIRDEIFGLRRYMCRVSKAELMRIMRSNPDYYYALAPYALALGVDKRFAKRFDNIHQRNCTWLITGIAGATTALQWYPLLREAVDSMNNLQKRPPWEKFMNIR